MRAREHHISEQLQTCQTDAVEEQHGQSYPLAVPQLGFGASSGRAWRLWAARHSQGEAGPLGAQPLPRVLELAASKAADLTPAFDPTGDGENDLEMMRMVGLPVAAASA